MKKLLVTFLIVILTVLLVAAGSAAYFFLVLPSVGPLPEITVEGGPEQVERGRYLANHVMTCVDCHSQRDWNRFSGPLVEGTEGRGGDRYDHSMGIPGVVHATNITPVGVGTWSDGELLRSITTGVNPQGVVSHPVMPYPAYNALCEEDAAALVAYLRSLPSAGEVHPVQELDLATRLALRTLPEPWKPEPCPDPADLLARGRYLTEIANCSGCHSPHSGGGEEAGEIMSGGDPFPMPGGTVIASNLTPDSMTGLGGWDLEVFTETFRRYADPEDPVPVVARGKMNTVMAWTMYAGLSDADLEAMFAYLQSLPPIERPLEVWQPSP